jgi:hypothetical protein
LRGHAEVVLTEDVVAVEHAPREVAGHCHGHALGDARSHHVPGGGPSQVVEQLVGDAGRLGGRRPGLSEVTGARPSRTDRLRR